MSALEGLSAAWQQHPVLYSLMALLGVWMLAAVLTVAITGLLEAGR